MRRDQLEHTIRTAYQTIDPREVIVIGSQAILGSADLIEGVAGEWSAVRKAPRVQHRRRQPRHCRTADRLARPAGESRERVAVRWGPQPIDKAFPLCVLTHAPPLGTAIRRRMRFPSRKHEAHLPKRAAGDGSRQPLPAHATDVIGLIFVASFVARSRPRPSRDDMRTTLKSGENMSPLCKCSVNNTTLHPPSVDA